MCILFCFEIVFHSFFTPTSIALPRDELQEPVEREEERGVHVLVEVDLHGLPGLQLRQEVPATEL